MLRQNCPFSPFMIWFSKENRERSISMLLTQSQLVDKRTYFDDCGMLFDFLLNWGGVGGEEKKVSVLRRDNFQTWILSLCKPLFSFDTSFPKLPRVNPYGWHCINCLSCFPNCKLFWKLSRTTTWIHYLHFPICTVKMCFKSILSPECVNKFD